jgi:hypothetical protein
MTVDCRSAFRGDTIPDGRIGCYGGRLSSLPQALDNAGDAVPSAFPLGKQHGGLSEQLEFTCCVALSEMCRTRAVLSPEPVTRMRLERSMAMLKMLALCVPTSTRRMGSALCSQASQIVAKTTARVKMSAML